MMPRKPARRTPVLLRKSCTVLAILSCGLIAGALLGECSLMNLNLTRPTSLLPRGNHFSANVNGYLTPSDSRGQSRRPVSQPRGIMAHHTGL